MRRRGTVWLDRNLHLTRDGTNEVPWCGRRPVRLTLRGPPDGLHEFADVAGAFSNATNRPALNRVADRTGEVVLHGQYDALSPGNTFTQTAQDSLPIRKPG